MTEQSYIHSHIAEDKGIQYDEYYQGDPWLRYLWNREQEILLDQILPEFFEDRKTKLLDFACGTGRILSVLEDNVESSCGIDVSDSMLRVAREKLHRSCLTLGNMLERAYFLPRQFNLVTAFRFFVNAEPPLRMAALKAIREVLSDDGLLVFNNHHNRYSIRRSYQRGAARLKGTKCNVNFLSMSEIVDLVSAGGFEVLRIYSAGLLHIPRISLPSWIYFIADRGLGRSQALAGCSESPVLVCRKAKKI